jgi:hypothetical protein
MTVCKQAPRQVRAYKAGTAGYQYSHTYAFQVPVDGSSGADTVSSPGSALQGRGSCGEQMQRPRVVVFFTPSNGFDWTHREEM